MPERLAVACHFICILVSSTLFAQELPLKHVESFSKDFAPSGTPATALLEDHFGFIWVYVFGKGLVRYDAARNEYFTSEQGLPASIYQMEQDAGGYLWVSSLNTGLYRTTLPLASRQQSNLAWSDSVGELPLLKGRLLNDALAKDQNGAIWGKTDHLLVRYTSLEEGAIQADTLIHLPDSSKTLINNIYAGTDNDMWVALTVPARLVRLNALAEKYNELERIDVENPDMSTRVHHADEQGGLWVSFFQQFSYLTPPGPSGEREKKLMVKAPGEIEDFLPLKNGKYLVSLRGAGIYQFTLQALERLEQAQEGENREILLAEAAREPQIYHFGKKEGLANDYVFDLLKDQQGAVWMAHMDGISHMPADFAAFGAFTDRPLAGEAGFLPDAGVNFVKKGFYLPGQQDAHVRYNLLGTSSGLVVMGTNGETATLSQDLAEILSQVMLDAVQDNAGNWWLFTNSRGAMVLMPKGAEPFKVTAKSLDINLFGKTYTLHNVGADYIKAADGFTLPDAPELPVIIGISSQRFQVYHAENQWLWFRHRDFYPVDETIGRAPSLATNGQGALYISHLNGVITNRETWARSTLDSLYASSERVYPGEDRIRQISTDFLRLVPLTWQGDTLSNLTHLLYEDGTLWALCKQGLAKIDPASFAVTGLAPPPDPNGFYTLAASSTHIWLGSDSGLFGLHKQTGEVLRQARKADGMLKNNAWGPESVEAVDDSTIFYGTSDGLVVYRPFEDEQEPAGFPLYLRQTDFVEDDWGKNELKVSFAGLSYRDAGNVRYQTRLKGYDEDWSEETAETVLRYTSLPAYIFAKSYEFEVKAADYRAQWQTLAEPLRIVVQPPVWLRWWSLLIYGGVLVVAGRAFLQYRLKEQKRTLALQEAELIKQQRDEIQAKNAQNELLLKEIHHRVKNNLEVVSSLLSLQSAQIDDPNVQDAIKASRTRVQSMGLLHQKLYQGKNLAAIDMKEYFVNLGESILDSFGAEGQVQIKCAMQHLELDIDTAVPLGLIVNELLTNSLKYAFPDGRPGEIRIAMSEEQQNELALVIEDNGVGLPGDGRTVGTGFGSQLVQLLTQQLEGDLKVESRNGTHIYLKFKTSSAA